MSKKLSIFWGITSMSVGVSVSVGGKIGVGVLVEVGGGVLQIVYALIMGVIAGAGVTLGPLVVLNQQGHHGPGGNPQKSMLPSGLMHMPDGSGRTSLGCRLQIVDRRPRERVESFVAPLATFSLLALKLHCNDRFCMMLHRVIFHSKFYFVNTKMLCGVRKLLPSVVLFCVIEVRLAS